MKEDIVMGATTHAVEWHPRPDGGFEVRVNGETVEAEVAVCGDHSLSVLIGGRSFTFTWELEQRTPTGAVYWLAQRTGDVQVEVRDPRRWSAQRHAEPSGRARLSAPMAGKVVRVLAAVGEAVEAGAGVLVLEAMKMQNEVRSPKGGVLVACHVSAGQTVATHQLLAEVE